MKNLTSLSLRIQRDKTKPEGALLEYVSGGAGDTDTPNDLALLALRAFYLAYACEAHPDRYSPEEVQRMAFLCCTILEQQSLMLRSTFNLPLPTQTVPAPTSTPVPSPPPPAEKQADPAPPKNGRGLSASALGAWGQES